jgi:hypothetical protein
LTKYPLGVVRVLPFTVHSAGDYLAAALLLASPWALSFASGDGGLAAFYTVAGIAVLAVSLITKLSIQPEAVLGSSNFEGHVGRFSRQGRLVTAFGSEQ